MTTTFELVRNPFGKLVLTDAAGEVHENVAPARAFPVQAPEESIAIVSTDGKEVAWIDRLTDLPPAIAARGSASHFSSGRRWRAWRVMNDVRLEARPQGRVRRDPRPR